MLILIHYAGDRIIMPLIDIKQLWNFGHKLTESQSCKLTFNALEGNMRHLQHLKQAYKSRFNIAHRYLEIVYLEYF